MKHFYCGSVTPGCEATFTGTSDGEVLLQAVRHAADEHGMADAPAQAAVSVLDHIVDAA